MKGQVSLLPPRRARRSTGNYTQVILGKTVEKIFLEKISNHVKDKKVIRSCPHGFTSFWRQVYLECSVYFGFPSMSEIDLLEWVQHRAPKVIT